MYVDRETEKVKIVTGEYEVALTKNQ